jgi:hypothetical protein
MVISPDGTKAFVAVTKAGSTSAEHILTQYCGALKLGDRIVHQASCHATLRENFGLVKNLVPSARLEDIKCYAFRRDPVDRWCSSINYWNKRTPEVLLTLESVKRDFQLSHLISSIGLNRFHKDIHISQDTNIWDIFPQEVTDELASMPWESFPVTTSDEPAFFRLQSYWLREPNTTIMDFAKFDSEMTMLVREWGGTEYCPTQINKSEIEYLSPVSESVRAEIHRVYNLDYSPEVMPNYT